MSGLGRLADRLGRRLRGHTPLPVWQHPTFRLSCVEALGATGIEPRRADLAWWAVEALRLRYRFAPKLAPQATWAELGLVHTDAHLDAVTNPRDLSRMFGLDTDQFPVDTILDTLRHGVGGVIAAARHARLHGGPTVCLLGGFHHAFPDHGGGLCALNDVAVAVAVLRAEGFDGPIAVLDLDAHPPDGTAAALAHDPKVWIGSISGSDWGPLAGAVDETLLPPGSDDAACLSALRALLDRAPPTALTFVLAGADPLAGDRFGRLAMTEAGLRERDRLVLAWLDDGPSVWVPAGGYRPDAWRVLANTLLELTGDDDTELPADLDPLAAHFDWIAGGLDPHLLGLLDTDEPLDERDLFHPDPNRRRLLDHYTTQGLELALARYGVLDQLRHLGYRDLRVEIRREALGDRLLLTGTGADAPDGARHLLVEAILAVEVHADERWLFVHWLTLRHPRGSFAPGRRPLPGQEVPGLGLGREAGELLLKIAQRLDLAGVMLRPAWVHTAWGLREGFRFLDPTTEGEFEALLRDRLPNGGITALAADLQAGRVRKNDEPWTWRAEPMAFRAQPGPDDRAQIDAARDAATFTVA